MVALSSRACFDKSTPSRGEGGGAALSLLKYTPTPPHIQASPRTCASIKWITHWKGKKTISKHVQVLTHNIHEHGPHALVELVVEFIEHGPHDLLLFPSRPKSHLSDLLNLVTP